MVIILFCFTLTFMSNSHFNNNPNNEEMMFHLMRCVNYIIKQLFYDKNNIKLFERNSNNRKYVTKHVLRKNNFVITEFRILKGLKG